MRLPNVSKYMNLDDFVRRNNIEVMSFQDGVVARWKSSQTYKSGMQRVTETQTNQAVGANFEDLSKKLKKELRKLLHFPWIFFFTSILCVVFISTGVSTDVPFIVIFGIVWGILSAYFCVIETVELIHAIQVLKSPSVLTRDHVKTFFGGAGSLFREVIKRIEEEESKVYKGEI